MVVLVQKKDGSLCFCLDFCRLNAYTKKDSYPLWHTQEALESMAGTTHFSMMDFKSKFWQVRMAPESQQYTTLMVGNLGFYELTQMHFGLCNFSTPHAEHLGRVELDLLCHLLRWHNSIQSHRRVTLGMLTCHVQMILQDQFEIEAIQVFVLPIRDCIPCASCFSWGDLPQQGKHLCSWGVPYARDLHPSLCILQTGRPL